MAAEWQRTSLAELIDVKHGFAFPGAFFWEEPPGDVLLTPGNFAIGGGFKADKLKYYRGEVPKEYILNENDLLITMTDLSKEADTLGFPALVPRSGAGRRYLHNQRLGKVIIRPGAPLENRFLYYLLCTREYRDEVVASATGTTVKHSSPSRIRAFRFNLPTKDEQRTIANILGALDDKIELNRRMNETIEAMARALFKSWFVDFDPVRAKGDGRGARLPDYIANSFPFRLVESELGQTPEGWRMRSLGEFVQIVKGCSYKSEELIESDTALVTLKSFSRRGGYRSEGLKSFAGKYRREQVVSPGELLIACTDVTQAAEVVGRAAVVRRSAAFNTLVASLDTMIVRPKQKVTRAFLYFLAGTDKFVSHTYAHSTGTTVLHLAKDAVPSFRFPLPAQPLVDAFDNLAGPVLDRIQASEQESETLAALRDTLLPKLISGELRVKDAEVFIEAVA
jgi:type I restriction enzyme S subunit